MEYLKVWKTLQKMEECVGKWIEGTPAEGLTVIQIHILNELFKEDGQHASTLARKVGRASTSFTPILDKLEITGFIKRGPDSQDRRAVRIWLTPKGEARRLAVTRTISRLDTEFASREPVEA